MLHVFIYLQNNLTQSQDKALRRISEMKEVHKKTLIRDCHKFWKCACPEQILVCFLMIKLENDLCDPLPNGQVRMKIYFPRRRIYMYLSQTMGWHFLQALELSSVTSV